ncbi:DUF362 domain-containing protein [Candidatus Latescibacterota bacterium]
MDLHWGNMNADMIATDRRDFLRRVAMGSLGLLCGCSDRNTSPTGSDLADPDPDPQLPPDPTTTIALHRTSDRAEGVTAVMELLDFPSMDGRPVVVKPNFNTADPAPASTHNDTLRQLMTEVYDRSASGITLAERSYAPFDQVIRTKGIDSMSADLGFSIQNLTMDGYSQFRPVGMHWQSGFRLPDTIRNAEYIVSTCCLKTHHTGVITMSLKLGVGIIPSLHMQELHGSPLVNSLIAEINLAYSPSLIVMDGVRAFTAGGPSQGTEVAGDVVIAGTDRIAVDAVGTAILKDLGSQRVPGRITNLEQIRRAMELELGIQKLEQIEFATADAASAEYAGRLSEILAQG